MTRILTPEYTLDLKKYEAYSPLFLSTTFALTYGLSFAAISSLIVHTGLFHGEEIWIRLRAPEGSLDDIHTKMMRKYKPAPTWWYLAVLIISIAMTMGMIYGYQTHMTWWSVLIAFLIALVWAIPIVSISIHTMIRVASSDNISTGHRAGCHEYTARPKCVHRVHHRIHVTWTSYRYDAFQNLRLYHYEAGPRFRSRSEARLVSEGATSDYVLGSGRSDYLVVSCAIGGRGMVSKSTRLSEQFFAAPEVRFQSFVLLPIVQSELQAYIC